METWNLPLLMVTLLCTGRMLLDAASLNLFPCGKTQCDVRGFGQYCEDGRCESCERYFDLCKKGCEDITIPEVCRATIECTERVKQVLKEAHATTTSTSTEKPVSKEVDSTPGFSPREHALIAVTVILTVAVCVLTLVVCWQNRKSRRKNAQISNGTAEACSPGKRLPTEVAGAGSREEKEVLCPAEDKIKGVDETGGDNKTQQVTSQS